LTPEKFHVILLNIDNVDKYDKNSILIKAEEGSYQLPGLV
jgi:hypothetical protein